MTDSGGTRILSLDEILNMPEGTEPVREARDVDRMEKLGEVSRRYREFDEGTLISTLLLQSAELWWDFLDTASYYPGSKPEESPLAATNTSFTSRLDQQMVDNVITRFMTIDMKDDEGQRILVAESMYALMNGVSSAGHTRRQDDPARIVTDAGTIEDPRYYVTAWRGRANMLVQGLHTYEALTELEKRSAKETDRVDTVRIDLENASSELQALQTQLKQAREERAQNALSDHFKTLGESEHKISWAFRIATFLLLGGAALVASKAPDASKWQDAVAHLSVVLAIGAAAAYTSRLGTLHRTTADWAKGIQIQLNTFQDFLATVTDDDVKNRVYEEFGRRVLGSPPILGKAADDSAGLPAAQIVELATIIAAGRK